jgi:membrane protein DedA with SNARE-associated domain
VTILTWIGYFIGANQELIQQYSNQALIGVVIASAAIIFFYVRNHRKKKRTARANGRA